MSRIARRGILLALCLVVVAGLVLTGCGKKKEAALQQPGVEFRDYIKGSTVDFDDATLNSMAAGSEANFKYGIMKAVYPALWGANKDTVAQALFPAPYWRGDGVHTYYSYLSSADQTAVDGTIFATKLSAAEQAIVTNTVESFFGLYADEIAAAKPMGQNTAYTVLYYKVSADAANAWSTEATAWVTALNSWASTNKGGKTYAQLTYLERMAAKAAVFNNGAGTINPEYSFWRIMVQTSFRNGNASARWPDKRDALSSSMFGKTYAQLDCVQGPTVDGAVWASCNATEQAAVTTQINGLWNLATEQVNGVVSDNQNIYYQTLQGLWMTAPYLLTDNSSITAAAESWKTAVNTGTSENTSFYNQLVYGQPGWKAMLAYQYFGTDNYSALSTASQAVVDEADSGMMSLSVAQRSAAMPLSSNIIYQTLQYRVGSTVAAEGWASDASAGVNRELALYKWMAYESFRAGTAATFYPTQLAEQLALLYPGKAATALTACETLVLNAAVWAALGTGEQGYGTGAVSSMWGKVEAEMTDAFAIDQTTAASYLRATMYTAGRIADGKAFYSETAATNFKTDVEGGMLVRSAFYKWLAKEQVKESAAAAVLIRESVGEFYFKVTNPNEYDIRIDEIRLYFRTTAGASSQVIDGARQVLGDIWVPARADDEDGVVELKVLAPTKTYDLLSWLAMAGVNTNTARTMANEVFDKIQAGTIVWTAEVQVKVSHEDEVQNYTYTDLTVS